MGNAVTTPLLSVDLCLTLFNPGIDANRDAVYLPPEVRDIIKSYVFERITDDNIREAIRLWRESKPEAMMAEIPDQPRNSRSKCDAAIFKLQEQRADRHQQPALFCRD